MHYSNFLILTLISAGLAFTVEGIAAINIASRDLGASSILLASADSDKQVQVARRAEKSRSGKNAGSREKNIIREKVYRGEKRKLDFDAVDIRGERNNALGSQLGQASANKEFDLIKIRLRWHPEMIQSTSSLETGGSR